jgi:hypothetical protein
MGGVPGKFLRPDLAQNRASSKPEIASETPPSGSKPELTHRVCATIRPPCYPASSCENEYLSGSKSRTISLESETGNERV